MYILWDHLWPQMATTDMHTLLLRIVTRPCELWCRREMTVHVATT